MSKTRTSTRPQYIYIEVFKKPPNCRVTLTGPKAVLLEIWYKTCNDNVATVEYLGSSMRITLKHGSDYLFMKTTLHEEALKHGFGFHDKSSSIRDDYIVLSRQVKL